MSVLSQFADFYLLTRAAPATEPSAMVSQASLYRTHLYTKMLKGLTAKQMFQGGQEIQDYIQLSYTNTGRYVNPTDTFNYTGTNSATQIKVPWRFFTCDTVTYESEIDFQNDRSVIWKRVKDFKKNTHDLSFWESHEEALWATPDYEKMEAATTTGTGRPLSLRCFITDDGAAPSSSNGGIASGSSAWTTVMGVNPTTKTQWKNQYATYDNTSEATREATYILAMDKIWLRCQYQSPTSTEEYNKSTTLQKMRIVHNESTHLLLVELATARNNVLTPKNDIGYQNGQVMYHGIPTDYIARLDDIDTGADTGSTALYRSRFINFNHIRPIFHSGHFRRVRKFDGGAGNPNAMVLLEDTTENLWCANRREQGIVRAA
jgi:hypothetical protein